MEPYEIYEVIRKIRERNADDPGAGGTPGGLELAAIPLKWVEIISKDRAKTLGRLCEVKPELGLLCSCCMRAGTSRCASCGVRYCSQACRDEDWKRHKVVCKMFAGWDASKRPSEEHFAAIFLPTDRERPELVWCRFMKGGAKLEVAHPDIDRLKSCPMRGTTIHVNSSMKSGRMFLGHGLAVLSVYGLRESDEEALLNINKSIVSLADPGSLALYAGPHLIFAFAGNKNGRPGKGMDVVPQDWRHATDYILLSPKNTFISVTVPESDWFQMSTKINNTMSIIITKICNIENPIETVCAPATYWPIEGPCVPAVQIGLPWKTRYVQDCERGSFSEDMKYVKKYFQFPASERDGELSEWVTASKYRCGSMLVMPLAKHRLVHEHHVLAFNKYLDFALKRRVVPSKEGFLAYWEKYVAVVSKSESLDMVPNPYHRLPRREDLVIPMGGKDDYRGPLMNLLGHFAANGYKMEVEEENGVFVPKDVMAPFDKEGRFEFTAEERDVPGGPSVEMSRASTEVPTPSSSADPVDEQGRLLN